MAEKAGLLESVGVSPRPAQEEGDVFYQSRCRLVPSELLTGVLGTRSVLSLWIRIHKE